MSRLQRYSLYHLQRYILLLPLSPRYRGKGSGCFARSGSRGRPGSCDRVALRSETWKVQARLEGSQAL
jgi:hypothetical protein